MSDGPVSVSTGRTGGITRRDVAKAAVTGGAAAWFAAGSIVFREDLRADPGPFALVTGAATVLLLLVLAWARRRLQRDAVAIPAAFLAGIGIVAAGAAGTLPVDLSWGAIVWLVGATALAALAVAGWFRRVPAADENPLAEAARLAGLALAAGWLLRPFYSTGGIGAGDAHWYTLMLSDFLAQTRAGVFPVWVGASEYAFNGTISPLRLAPWFQHLGGLLDLVTFRQLEPLALKNAMLAANMLAFAFSCYFFLRRVAAAWPTLAWLLTLAICASPGVLAPLYVGDQYMTFLALPFLPVAAYGLWRTVQQADAAGFFIFGAGVGCLWAAHPPIALWTTLLTGTAFLVAVARERRLWQGRYVALAASTCALLGGYPVLSAVSLDNTNPEEFFGEPAGAEVAAAFPENFLAPLSRTLDQQSDYQAGYTIVAIFLVALVLLRRRTRGATFALLVACLLVLLLVIPVPGVTTAIWGAMPSAVMAATNNWPMQRLFPIWTVLVPFLLAALYFTRAPGPRWRHLAGEAVLALGFVWSLAEANRLIEKAETTRPPDARTQLLLARHNVQLTRYCFVTFASTPGYFSHGYVDPVLEHRLLRRDDLAPLVTNADSAVRRGRAPAPTQPGDLVARGTWRAVNDAGSAHFQLQPRLDLPAQARLALWINPRIKPEAGWIQLQGRDVFREYQLPDSGTGVFRISPPRSFGLLPTSPRVISLFTRAAGDRAEGTLILPERTGQADFDFAEYELWQYDPATLPIAVRSLVPYHVQVQSPRPAYVEVPRMWMRGYRAKINGQHVPGEKSPDNLVMFPVPEGASDMTIKWIPPLRLEIAYWIACLSWGALLVGSAVWLLLGRPRPDSV